MSRDISLSYEDGSTLTGADAIIQQYEIALFTVPTEFSSDPTFGIGIQQFIGEVNNKITAKAIKQRIVSETLAKFPEIAIQRILLTTTQDNQITIQLDVVVIPYGQQKSLIKVLKE